MCSSDLNDNEENDNGSKSELKSSSPPKKTIRRPPPINFSSFVPPTPTQPPPSEEEENQQHIEPVITCYLKLPIPGENGSKGNMIVIEITELFNRMLAKEKIYLEQDQPIYSAEQIKPYIENHRERIQSWVGHHISSTKELESVLEEGWCRLDVIQLGNNSFKLSTFSFVAHF